jgi:hypothetical protein
VTEFHDGHGTAEHEGDDPEDDNLAFVHGRMDLRFEIGDLKYQI